MPDREKVIRIIDELIFEAQKAPTWKAENALRCLKKELLKEQKAVEPKQVDLYGNDEWWGLVCVCPDCKAEWMSDKADTHFCPKCGRSVKWE